MEVTCPNCGYTFRAKRPLGTGTRVNTAKLSQLEELVLSWLMRNGPCTVRVLQRALVDNSVPVIGRAGWNYHKVQALLSRLVGKGYADMYKKGRQFIYRARDMPLFALLPLGHSDQNA